jgi:tetratricopeptide (TPR) repeat protein
MADSVILAIIPPQASRRSWRGLASIFLLPVLVIVSFSQASPNGQASAPTAVTLRVIVVSAESEAQQILDRLKKGEDFGLLAKSKSIDPHAEDYGYLGHVDIATLRPELREALRGLAPGQVTGIIKIPGAYAILKVLPESEGSVGQGMSANRDLPASGKAGIEYPADVAGQMIADLAFQKYPKPPGWEQGLREICEVRKQSLSTLESRLKNRLYPAPPKMSPVEKPIDSIQTHYALAQVEAYQGNMDQAVAEWEAAYQLAVASVPAGAPQLEAVLGVAYLHKSEMENGVYRDPDDKCIFPPRAGMKYGNVADSEKAVAYFSKYLARKPEDVQTKWLLNLAYMTMGKYPTGVPEKYLIPSKMFESRENIGRFIDVAPRSGLNVVSMANGLVVDDFDNDGLLDVMISSYDLCEPLHYFHNNGDGTFTDRAVPAGLADQLGGLNMIQADYNNDGCMDLLVLRGAWEFPIRKSLLRNNCDGTFADVTKEAGLAEPATRTQTAVWADIDNDGFVDLFVGNENGPSQLFRNRGDGTFEDISHSSGVDKIAFTKGVVAADYDNDGYMDFFVSNLYGANFLYHNNHDRTFTDVAQKAGVQLPDSQSFASMFLDYDNDGWPDLLVNSFFFSADESLRSYLGLPHRAETLKLFKNMKDGTFKDVTKEVGLDKVYAPMGANFGDVDNDGFLDIYLGTGGPEYGFLLPKVLLRNNEGKSFVDISASAGIGDLHKGHGTAFADLQNSGYEDILTSMGGATPGDAHAFRVFENPRNDNHNDNGKANDKNDWINLKLVGVKTNRAAIGARIKLTVENKGKGTRSIDRTVSSGGSFGASPLAQHIGLGKSASVRSMEISWPASGTSQKFSNVPPNQFLQITEFATEYKTLTPKRFRFEDNKPRVAALQPPLTGVGRP